MTTKIIQIFSDGSVNFQFEISNLKLKIYEKDHKNFFLNKKKKKTNFKKIDYSSKYKKQYLFS